MKTNVGLYVRVSTDRQARVDEGSLKSQVQRLEEWVKLANNVYEKHYSVYRVYQDVESGTTSQRSEYQKMLNDIRANHLSAVVAVSIGRLNRSLRDFYELQEICERANTAIISLKENFDTSTAIGRALLKFMLVFYELEAEQTGERVSDNKLARANRGLWVSGRVFGYRPVGGKPGHLEPDPPHSQTVTKIFELYLETGSIGTVRGKLRELGYRTASYTSERGLVKEPQDFSDETIRRILTNLVYVGKAAVNKGNKDVDAGRIPEAKRYRIIDGEWEPLITEDIFDRVQQVLKRNLSTRGNVVAVRKKSYILAGVIRCGRASCIDGASREGPVMLTSSGTSKSGKYYYYYFCGKCKTRVSAGEIEAVVVTKIAELSSDAQRLRHLTEATNRIVTEEVPKLRHELQELQDIRKRKNDEFDQILESAKLLDPSSVKSVLQERGEKVAKDLEALSHRIEIKEAEIEKQNTQKVDFQMVREVLRNFNEVFSALSPHEQQQIVQYLVDHVDYTEDSVRVALDTGVYIEPIKKGSPKVFSGTPMKRGGRDSNPRPPA
jgi:site-specific DNA recombinase